MLTQGRFLISYQVFDNIPVNNNGQTHVREILKDTQAFTFSYLPKQNKYTDTRYTTHLPHSQQRNIQITRYTINLIYT